MRFLSLLGGLSVVCSQQLKGDVQAVYDLLDRVLPGSKNHFQLYIEDWCGEENERAVPCFKLSDAGTGHVAVVASGANELAYGIGSYLREDCNMTIGWPRGGASRVFLPEVWPTVGDRAVQTRIQPWSYFMNVCTHSYSLVWNTWQEWESLIDWMALSGINNVLAMTGQEEVQYKVFRKFNLTDLEIRSWFNGPALLTWSRGQNEYGSDIAGPLPRSWMKDQWDLQRLILPRYRSLGIVGQLPGFQGNVPAALKDIVKDSNMTLNNKGTAWMDSLDPLFGEIADEWMKVLIEDFGTDHWYQLDGYFNGVTAPWLSGEEAAAQAAAQAAEQLTSLTSTGTCVFGDELDEKYVKGCSLNCKTLQTVEEAKSACLAENSCGGVTQTSRGYELRSGSKALDSQSHEKAWVIENAGTPDCHPPQPIVPDPTWMRRGAAAYGGLNRTDPEAIWSFQGWAFVGWNTQEQGNSLRGFIDATPKGKFVIIDMSVNGEGEWRKWDESSYWGAQFIWTTLHDFGGTDGMKGNLAQINKIPFDGMGDNNSTVVGTGFTPEGIDQNPVYYEFIIDQNWRSAPVANIAENVVARSHRRYGDSDENQAITEVWELLVDSAYAQDLSVQDNSGVKRFPGSASQFETDRQMPTPTLCKIFTAWDKLEGVAPNFKNVPTFRYDLVNLGRELLAQLTTPASMNFSDATKANPLVQKDLTRTGVFYSELLEDLDTLVSTEPAFLLGPWIRSARSWGRNNSNDCPADGYGVGPNCADFYEWNAKVQLTTWNPTPKDAAKIPGGPIDYAGKHWSGLIRDYYAARARLLLRQALADAQAEHPLDTTGLDRLRAELAYNWTTATEPYPTEVQGDSVEVSRVMLTKYRSYFSACDSELAPSSVTLI